MIKPTLKSLSDNKDEFYPSKIRPYGDTKNDGKKVLMET